MLVQALKEHIPASCLQLQDLHLRRSTAVARFFDWPKWGEKELVDCSTCKGEALRAMKERFAGCDSVDAIAAVWNADSLIACPDCRDPLFRIYTARVWWAREFCSRYGDVVSERQCYDDHFNRWDPYDSYEAEAEREAAQEALDALDV